MIKRTLAALAIAGTLGLAGCAEKGNETEYLTDVVIAATQGYINTTHQLEASKESSNLMSYIQLHNLISKGEYDEAQDYLEELIPESFEALNELNRDALKSSLFSSRTRASVEISLKAATQAYDRWLESQQEAEITE